MATAEKPDGYEIRVSNGDETGFANVIDVLNGFADDPIKFHGWGYKDDPDLEGAVKYNSPRTVSAKFGKMVKKTFTVLIKGGDDGKPLCVDPAGVPYSVNIVKDKKKTSEGSGRWWLNVTKID